MSRDYDLEAIHQDDPFLITYLREVHIGKNAYLPHLTRAESDAAATTNYSARTDLVAQMGRYVAETLFNSKYGGVYVQSLSGATDSLMTADWLSEVMQWRGVIVEPDPTKYFHYRKQNVDRRGVQVVHACISPTRYPKEIMLHEDENEVRINSVLDGDTGKDSSDLIETRVKCFPVFTVLMALNVTHVDLLSLGCHGLEQQVLLSWEGAI